MFSLKKPVRVLGDFVSVLESGDALAGTCVEVNTPFGTIQEVVVTVAPKANFDKQRIEIGDTCIRELGRVASIKRGVRFTGMATGYVAVIPDPAQPKRAHLVYVENLANNTNMNSHGKSPRELSNGRIEDLAAAMDAPIGEKAEKVISSLITSPIRNVR